MGARPARESVDSGRDDWRGWVTTGKSTRRGIARLGAPEADRPDPARSTRCPPSPPPARRRTSDPVRRALCSVYDKTGLEELARGLHEAGVALVSTGSTAARSPTPASGHQGRGAHRLPRVPGRPGEDPAPEGARGHPRRPPRLSTVDQLNELDIEPFDLVVVNLYPFTETVASGATPDECVEQIDIGGPSMVRAAAKNHPRSPWSSPARYDDVLAAVPGGGFTLEQRSSSRREAFAHTAPTTWRSRPGSATRCAPAPDGSRLSRLGRRPWERAAVLRYGENPHQRAALYVDGPAAAGLAAGRAAARQGDVVQQLHRHRRRRASRYDHGEPCVAIIKHANPCGIAVGARRRRRRTARRTPATRSPRSAESSRPTGR